MGIAGHEYILVSFTLLHQRVEEGFSEFSHLLQLGTGKEFQVNKHLVVARTSAMNLLANVTQGTSQHQLHLRMDILDALFNHKLAFHGDVVNLFQFVEQDTQFISRKQSDALQHSDVGHAAQYVVWSQIEVHLSVSADGEPLNLFIYLCGFFPKLHFR